MKNHAAAARDSRHPGAPRRGARLRLGSLLFLASTLVPSLGLGAPPVDDLFQPLRDQQKALEAKAPAADAATLTPADIRTLVALGRIDEAASRLDKLTGDPREVEVVRLSVALLRQDFAAARTIVEPLLKARREPTDTEREVMNGWLFATDNSPEIDARTRTLAVTPGTTAPVPDLIAAGRLAYNMLNFDRAESCFARALERSDALLSTSASALGWKASALRGLGQVQYRRRDFDGALAFHRRAVEAMATPDVLMGLAETLVRLGRTDDAITGAEWSVKLNRYNDAAHYYLGNGYARKNYTELRTAFPAAFADDAGKKALAQADEALAAGRRDDSRKALGDIVRDHPGWIEPLVRLASLDFEDERFADSRDHCYEALAICPDYGRAHATLAKALEFQRFEIDVHRPDYEARFAAMPTPKLPGIEKYVANWASLSPRHQKRVALSVEPWKNFLPVLLEGGCTHYIKPLYQLLSDTPGLETLKDQRISYDSRLWDDVRGAGGYNTVTGVEDVSRMIFDRYNTVLHELTHQVHGVMTADESREIQEHYRKAKERDGLTKNGFLSRYAGGSVFEYFAEGANALRSKRRDAYDSREEVTERLEKIDPDLMALVKKFMTLTDVEANYPIAYVNAGQDRVGKGAIDPGIAYFQKALARAPNEETALTALVAAEAYKGDRDHSKEHAGKAIELYGSSGSVRTTAADALWRSGEPLEEILKGLQKDRTSIRSEDRYQVDLAIGSYAWNLGRVDQALAAYDSVLAYQSDSPDALWGKASTLALAERWNEAFPLYDQAVRLRTGLVSLRCDVARDLIRAGRLADAKTHLDEAKILERENPIAEAIRGWASLASGNPDEALTHARQAKEWGPWCDLAIIIEGEALKAKGDMAGASAALAPLTKRIADHAPPEYTYLPKLFTWQSIHELPAVERAMIAQIAGP